MAWSHFSYRETKIDGCFRVTPFLDSDVRGKFCKPYSQMDYVPLFGTRWEDKQFPVPFSVLEAYYSYNRRGALRGLHIQENTAKLVTCQKGFIQDIVVDLRKNSKTYMQVQEFLLYDHESIYVPSGCAHGFKACKASIILYLCDEVYRPQYDTGIRYDDPTLNIEWAWKDVKNIVSRRDKGLPTFKEWRKAHDTF